MLDKMTYLRSEVLMTIAMKSVIAVAITGLTDVTPQKAATYV